MKKNAIALLLSIVLAAGSIGTALVFAAETTAEEAVAVEEEVSEIINDADTGITADEITEEDLMEYPGFKDFKQVFMHDEEDRTIDLNDKDLDPTKALRESFEKQMEDVKKEIEEEAKKEKAMKKNKKYFQSKEYKDNDDAFGIKANKDKKEKHSKGHNKKKKKPKKRMILNIEFSPAEELLKYAELLEKGYLTKEEFEKKKEELLKIKYSLD